MLAGRAKYLSVHSDRVVSSWDLDSAMNGNHWRIVDLSQIACYPFGAFADLIIPLGHLRDLIVYLWDILSCGILVVFCGTLVDFRTCLVVPLNVLDC
jgi:hypothetical protein